jgi:hypothetical protein
MGVDPAAGAQIQDDVKRTGALTGIKKYLEAPFTGTEIQISAVTAPSEAFQAAVVIRCVSQFLFVSKIVLGRQRSIMFVGLQFNSRQLFGMPLGVSS